MPVDTGEPCRDPRPTFYDNRRAKNGYGVNGHVNLLFSGPTLKTVYVDMNGQRLLWEEWSVDSDGGVRLVSKEKLIRDADFHA